VSLGQYKEDYAQLFYVNLILKRGLVTSFVCDYEQHFSCGYFYMADVFITVRRLYTTNIFDKH